MYYFLFGVAVGAAAVSAVVIFRKFPQLTTLDVGSLPSEREAVRKRELLRQRIEARGAQLKARTGEWLAPLERLWKALQRRFRRYVARIEHLWYHEERVRRPRPPEENSVEQVRKIQSLIAQAEERLQSGEHEPAEQLFVSALRLDQNATPAYRGLGDSYLARGSLEEARETYRFVLKLEPDDDSVMVKLAEIAESQGDLDEAINWYQQAVLVNDALSPRWYHLAELLLKVKQPATAQEAVVSALELEPRNPKYLDLLTEIAILGHDKETAEGAFNELRLVNPENQKLADFAERIRKLV